MIERSYQRFPASFPGAVLADNGTHIIQSVDLSRKGCRIQNTAQLDPGMSVDLLLFPPGEEMPIVILDARVRWSGAEGIGIQFQAVADHHQETLDLLINKLKKPH